MTYRTLNPDRIEATLETLHNRIQERFPNRGLANLCKQLLDIARDDKRMEAMRAGGLSHARIRSQPAGT